MFGDRTVRMLLAATLAGGALWAAGCEGDSGSGTTGGGQQGNGGGNGGGGDTAGEPGGAPAGLSCNEALKLCTLSGEYTSDLHLTKDYAYLLQGGVFIGDDTSPVTLTIDPGTEIFGDSGASVLVIRRSAKIMAMGTRDEPIVFSSAREVGSRGRGDWGGLVINGRAKINSCGGAAATCEAEGEGDTGKYGGDDDADSSGELRYVRVEFAGYQITADNELNGIAFQAVGSGTVVENLQLHMNADDGIEFFGGAVSIKNILVTGSGDDSLDWTDGWRGKGQFIVVQQYEDESDNGIEADNLKADNTAEPRSEPVLSNLTLIGSPDSSSSDIGALLREGTGVHISNAIFTGFNEACIDLDNAETFANAGTPAAPSGQLTLTHSILDCTTNFNPAPADGEPDPWSIEDFFTGQDGVQTTDPMLADPFNMAAPGFALDGGSPAKAGAVVPDDPFFTKVSFIGGVDPSDDWTAGWTTAVRE